MPGVGALADLAVHPGLDIEAVGVSDLIGGDDPGSQRAMSIEGFAERHGGRLDLPVPHAHVVHHGEAGDHLGRPLSGNVTTAPSDHEGELPLVVEGAGDPREVDRIAWPGDTGDLFVEEGGEFRRRPSRLVDVLGVVEPDRQALAGLDRCLQADLGEGNAVSAGVSRLGGRFEGGAAGLEECAHHSRQIGHSRREIHQIFGRDDPETGRIGMSEGDELHGPSPPSRKS